MEIVDVVTGHDCVNCCIKHLAASLAYRADGADPSKADEMQVLMGRAAVCLVECESGYNSHLSFAVGLLVRAEECAVELGDGVARNMCRSIRLGLVEGTVRPGAAYRMLSHYALPSGMSAAHEAEARREFPGLEVGGPSAEDLVAAIRRLVDEYFRLPAHK